MPARLASGCLRPLGQPSKGIGYEKAHPRWDRLFRYSDYTRQRNTKLSHVQTSPPSRSARSCAQANSSMMFHSQ